MTFVSKPSILRITYLALETITDHMLPPSPKEEKGGVRKFSRDGGELCFVMGWDGWNCIGY